MIVLGSGELVHYFFTGRLVLNIVEHAVGDEESADDIAGSGDDGDDAGTVANSLCAHRP